MVFPYVPDIPLCSTNIPEAADAGLFLHQLDEDACVQLFKCLRGDLNVFDAHYLSTTAKEDPEGTLARLHILYQRLVGYSSILSILSSNSSFLDPLASFCP